MEISIVKVLDGSYDNTKSYETQCGAGSYLYQLKFPFASTHSMIKALLHLIFM